MSSFGKTKREIMAQLSKRQQTLTDLSRTLDLSPSTVKQHLEELERIGAILPVDNEFVKRWKYYKPNPVFGAEAARIPSGAGSGLDYAFPYIVGALAILTIATVLAFGLSGNALTSAINGGMPTTSQTTLFAVRLTDPPSVPPGTDGLYIQYSSVEIHVLGNNTWVTTQGSGVLNLTSLMNSSQVISNVYINGSAQIDKVWLNITNATVNINNVNYSMVIAGPTITATLSQPQNVSLNQSILVSFSPTVATVYGINSTTFVFVPCLKAMYLNSGLQNLGNIGSVIPLSVQQNAEIDLQQPNISVLNATLISGTPSTNLGRQSITLTVKNNANYTVNLTQATIQGDLEFYLNANTAQQQALNISIPWIPKPLRVEPSPSGTHAQSGAGLSGLVQGTLLFAVESNGTMLLPNSKVAVVGLGYQLGAGQTGTLTFNNTMSFVKGRLDIGLVHNDTYNATLVSNEGPVVQLSLKSHP